MAQEVFKRTEKKYLLDRETYEELVKRLAYYMDKDKYFGSEIMSIYFDTPDYRLIRTSIEKPVFKEKIRLRSYGVPSSEDEVFLEIKRKFKGVVYKRRSEMPLNEAVSFTRGAQIQPHNQQIENEIKWAFNYYNSLSPKMMISYHRHAYVGKDNKNLRITFDDRILYRDYDLNLSNGIYGEELLKDGQRLMEIKIPDAMPLWLSDILDELEIFSTSFSKYGTAYQTLLKNNALGKHRGSATMPRAI